MNLVIARSVATKQSSDFAFCSDGSRATALDCFAALAMTNQRLTRWVHGEDRSDEAIQCLCFALPLTARKPRRVTGLLRCARNDDSAVHGPCAFKQCKGHDRWPKSSVPNTRRHCRVPAKARAAAGDGGPPKAGPKRRPWMAAVSAATSTGHGFTHNRRPVPASTPPASRRSRG